ncbi:hypothetical protein FG386_002107 [Cryptosporidium ryanae]|uniref:uncharacterized protein n=1 Tax=Cryptosporidium ryanae TaxID=515981 RepID=UPI00351AAEA3|nr:hypothetical protein FG386_002107 [Cryptosporidium ryanae]
MRLHMTGYCFLLVLPLIGSASFVFGNESETRCSSAANNLRESSLKGFFELVNREGKGIVGSLKFKSLYASHLDASDLEVSLCKDVSGEGTLKPIGVEMDKYTNICHIPSKKASLVQYKLGKSYIKGGFMDLQKKFFYPRVKSYRKELPQVITEPYQRLMTFAIEVCMVPSVWYLELVHCMFVSTLPYLNGMLMSYSLQDIIGSALMSMEYKNEKFNLESCMESASNVKDDAISSQSVEICHRMKTCLDSREFSSGDFYELEPELSYRIKNMYGNIQALSGMLKPSLFARYSVLYSIHLLSSKFKPNDEYPEVNFLPIRIMNASLSYYAMAKKLNLSFQSESKVVELFAKIITSLMFEDASVIIDICRKSIIDFGNKHLDGKILEVFCKEIFSVGFINEDIGIHINKVDGYLVHPKRILLESYISVIPEMMQSLPIDRYDYSWLNFTITGDKKGIEVDTKSDQDLSEEEEKDLAIDQNFEEEDIEIYKKKKKKSFSRTIRKLFSRLINRKGGTMHHKANKPERGEEDEPNKGDEVDVYGNQEDGVFRKRDE